jgi:predicted DNA-binding transcriptional regulator YafY
MPAAASHETLVRQLQMLQLIPRSPAQITVADLTAALSDQGYSVTSRTVQRDLNDIALVMPLECNDRSKPYGWKWSREGRTHLPMMSVQEALTLHLVHQHLVNLLPPSMIDDLQPMFRQALQTLSGLGDQHRLQHWLNSVVVEQPAQPLIAPVVDVTLQHTLYQSVFEQKQLSVRYRAIEASEPKALTLHPLGIIQRGPISYLGATVNDYEDIRLFAFHRFESVILKPLDSATPKNKQTWQAYLTSGAGGFHDQPKDKLRLEASISLDLAARLTETPLSDNQTITMEDNKATVTAEVFDTWQLTWWILSQGSRIEVKKPLALRETIKKEVMQMAARYAV